MICQLLSWIRMGECLVTKLHRYWNAVVEKQINFIFTFRYLVWCFDVCKFLVNCCNKNVYFQSILLLLLCKSNWSFLACSTQLKYIHKPQRITWSRILLPSYVLQFLKVNDRIGFYDKNFLLSCRLIQARLCSTVWHIFGFRCKPIFSR